MKLPKFLLIKEILLQLEAWPVPITTSENIATHTWRSTGPATFTCWTWEFWEKRIALRSRASAVMVMPGLLVLGWDRCLVWERHRIFFFFTFSFARTEKLVVKGNRQQHFSTTSHPITFLLLPCVYILLPLDGWDGNNTPGGDFRGCLRKKISSYFQIIRRRRSNQV